jgi:uncharacterized protein DUF695
MVTGPIRVDGVCSLAEDAAERFAVLEGRDAAGRPALVLVDRALDRAAFPGFDVHLAVEVAIARPTHEGFPGAAEGKALDALEDDLRASLRGRAAYLGRVTAAGRRALHFFTTLGVREDVEARIAGRASATFTSDPEWKARRVLGG